MARSSFVLLPLEIQSGMFRTLSVKDVLNFSLVCKNHRDMVNSNQSLWKDFHSRFFGELSSTHMQISPNIQRSFKDILKEAFLLRNRSGLMVLNDIFTGDALCCTAFPMKEFGDVAYEVKGTLRKFVETCPGFEDDPMEGDECLFGDDETPVSFPTEIQRIDVIQHYGLHEVLLDNGDFMAIMKYYLQKVLLLLQETNPSRAQSFREAAQPFVQSILRDFCDYSFYLGTSGSWEGMIIPMRWDEVNGYRFYLFKDALVFNKA